MDSLPADLLPHIISPMSAHDVQSLYKAVRSKSGDSPIELECKRRLCVKTYLSQSFGDPLALLSAMSRSMVVISGSRSLEFFTPGSCDEDSNWDFYIGNGEKAVSRFVLNSSKAGIRWLTPIQQLEKILTDRRGSMSVLGSVWMGMVECGAYEMMESMGVEVRGRGVAPGGYSGVKVRVVNEGERPVSVSLELYHPREVTKRLQHIIYGENLHKGKRTSIQLVSEGSDLLLKGDFLLDFHSTCAQSYLSAHTACHLYGRLTSKRRIYPWPPSYTCNDDNEPCVAPYVMKYESKGYNCEFYRTYGNGSKVLRISGDEGCTLLPCYNHVRAPSTVVSFYEIMSRSLCWYEGPTGTKCAFNPIGSSDRSWIHMGQEYNSNIAACWSMPLSETSDAMRAARHKGIEDRGDPIEHGYVSSLEMEEGLDLSSLLYHAVS